MQASNLTVGIYGRALPSTGPAEQARTLAPNCASRTVLIPGSAQAGALTGELCQWVNDILSWSGGRVHKGGGEGPRRGCHLQRLRQNRRVLLL